MTLRKYVVWWNYGTGGSKKCRLFGSGGRCSDIGKAQSQKRWMTGKMSSLSSLTAQPGLA